MIDTRSGLLAVVILGGIAAGCTVTGKATSNDPAELLQADRDFAARALQAGAAQAFREYLLADALQLPDGQSPRVGRDAIFRAMHVPGLVYTLDWTPRAGEVAGSGDLGYTWGDFELRYVDRDGTAVRRTGKYLNVWQRDTDGHWRVKVDMGNDNPPAKAE